MRKFTLIISWLLWLVALLCTASAILVRTRASHLSLPAPPAGIEQFNLLFWGATIMAVAFEACLYLLRYHYWFLPKRQVGIGFYTITFVFYIVLIFVPYMGFAPFFEGSLSALQWVSCAFGVVLLIVGFPKLPRLSSPSEVPAIALEPSERKRYPKAALVASIACGLIAIVSPTLTVHILKSKPPAKHVQESPSGDFGGLTNPASIVFSRALPPSWKITEQSSVTNQYSLVGNRVLLRSADQKRVMIVSVVGKRIEGEALQTFVDTWKPAVIDGLKSGYGDNIQEDGFSSSQQNGRAVAHLESHTSISNGILNFLTEGWVENGFPVTCQIIGKGVAVTNDQEITDILKSIRLNEH